MLSLLLLMSAVPGRGEELTLPDILTRWGVLTAEEAALLTVPTAAPGEEIVRTITFDVSATGMDSAATEAALEILRKSAITLRSGPNEVHATLSIDGTEVVTLGFGLRGDEARLVMGASGAQPVAVPWDELVPLLVRLAQIAEEQELFGEETDDLLLGDWAIALLHSPWWADPSWLSLLRRNPADFENLNLTAWNETIAALAARRTFAPDGAGRVWSLTVDTNDLLAVLRAILVTVRDNPVLCDLVAEQIGYGSYIEMTGTQGSLAEELLDPLIAEIDASPRAESNWMMDLTGWEDDAGTLLRLTGAFLGMAAEEALTTFTYDREAAEGEILHRVVVQDNDFALGLLLTEGENGWAFTLAEIDEEAWNPVYSLAADLDVTRAEGGTNLETNLTAEMPSPDEPDVTWRSAVTLAAELHVDSAGYYLTLENNMLGPDIAAEGFALYTSVPVDEAGLCGAETLVLDIAEGKSSLMLGVTSQVRKQAAEASLFDGEALYLNDLTDEELSAWVAEKAEELNKWEYLAMMLLSVQGLELRETPTPDSPDRTIPTP